MLFRFGQCGRPAAGVLLPEHFSLFLHQSNTLHLLFNQLRAQVSEPLAAPFAPEIIVVQNQGMAQWVSQQLAFATGIAANLAFPLPARCIWDLYHRLAGTAPVEDIFRKPVLHWRIFSLLPQYREHPAFREIGAYLQDDPGESKRYQLAGTISDIFDQYLIYRPDMLEAWQRQPDASDWQALLWQRLTASGRPLQLHVPAVFSQLLQAADETSNALPQRLHLFGINSLAPVYLDIFARLGRHTEVHLFHLSPCRQFWGDLQAPRQEARLREKTKTGHAQPVPAPFSSGSGNPLLLSLGKTGQDFFRQLLEYDLQDFDLYHQDGQQHLLAILQQDILDLVDRSALPDERFQLQPGDRSVQFHICHSPMREIQNLHDRLLDLFQGLPDLHPGDIRVTAPDIRMYASAIAAVFGGAAPELRIPYSLADLNASEEQPVTRCFLDLLGLLSGRFTAPEILALCESGPLLRRFGLDASLLPRLHGWVRESGIRWGMDAAHRRQLGIDAGGQPSWPFGFDRMLLGYLTGDSLESFCGVMPYGRVGADEPAALGNFISLVQTMASWRTRWQQPQTMASWHQDLNQMLADFFDPEAQEQGLATLRDSLRALQSDCALAGMTGPVSPEVIRQCLEQALTQPGGGQAFLSGKITFCNMVPMRSVPFRVICLLGMNDQDFPRSQYPVAFNRMGQEPRLGDRNRRDDDRYLFLESLLSAREVLSISWIGRNLRDNSLCPPSAVVSELQEYINQSCHVPDGLVSETLTTTHPLQPFSRSCFSGAPATASYNRTWLPAAAHETRPPFLTGNLPEPDDPEWRLIDVTQFIRFWRHPVRFFLRERLGMRLGQAKDYAGESEPFTLDALEQFRLRQDIVSGLLRHQADDQLFVRLSGSGCLPQSMFGQLQFDELAETGAEFAAALAPLVIQPCPPLEIDLTLGAFRLTGWLNDLYQAGRVTWRSAQLKGETLMEVWINHLLLNLAAQPGLPRGSTHLARGSGKKKDLVSIRTLQPVAAAEPYLHELLAAYWQGLLRPLPFFPKTSLAYASAEPEKALQQARQCWSGGFQRPGEGDEPEYRYFFSQVAPLNTEFAALSALYHPILEHMDQAYAET